jgi:demethylmenaquinone methyltransferase/2-methoxy-6-polyprenyl-1,4-benzoquinol methylase
MTEHTLDLKYDRAAGSWHQSLERLQFLGAYERLMGQLTETGHIRLPPNPCVLDAGIGTGALSLALASQQPDVGQVVGVDISQKMLDETAANLREHGLGAQLVQHSVTALEFAGASFDLVMNAHILEHLTDPADGLRELVRVLKPGAPLLTVTSRWCPFTMIQQGWWRYRIIPLRRLKSLMCEVGLERVEEITYADQRHIRHMSRAVIAHKRV